MEIVAAPIAGWTSWQPGLHHQAQCTPAPPPSSLLDLSQNDDIFEAILCCFPKFDLLSLQQKRASPLLCSDVPLVVGCVRGRLCCCSQELLLQASTACASLGAHERAAAVGEDAQAALLGAVS